MVIKSFVGVTGIGLFNTHVRALVVVIVSVLTKLRTWCGRLLLLLLLRAKIYKLIIRIIPEIRILAFAHAWVMVPNEVSINMRHKGWLTFFVKMVNWRFFFTRKQEQSLLFGEQGKKSLQFLGVGRLS